MKFKIRWVSFLYVFWFIFWNISLEEILLCKKKLQGQRTVKHTTKLILRYYNSSIPVVVYTTTCRPGKWLFPHIFICIHAQNISVWVLKWQLKKKKRQILLLYFWLLVILKIGDLCLWNASLCTLTIYFWGASVFLYIRIWSHHVNYPVLYLLHILQSVICFLHFYYA